MNKHIGVMVAMLATALVGSGASASGDYSCSQPWKLAGFAGMDCGNRAMLTPGNDTRVNLFLLQRGGSGIPARPVPYPAPEWDDRAFGHSFFTWHGLRASYGYPTSDDVASGSRCDSLTSGGEAFSAALAANGRLSADERSTLTAARGMLAARCPGDGEAKATAGVWPYDLASAPARAFLAYLQAADAFYAGSWDAARTGFAALQKAPDPWVAETATYMAIRVDLNAAQDHAFDEYGDFAGAAKTDQPSVARARAAIDAYLKRYPRGRYAASADGLRRRAYWLGGDHAALADAYEKLLATMAPDQATLVIQEIDNKLLFASDAGQAIRTPQLLAIYDLLHMRQGGGDEDGNGPWTPMPGADLVAQKARFAGQPDLFAYLTAAHAFHVDRDNTRALSLLPAMVKGGPLSPLDFSRQMLRGMAMAAARDPREEAQWRSMLDAARAPYQRELVELGLALMWQRAGRIATVFAPGSPVQDPTIRILLLSRIAGPDLLRQVAGDAKADRRVRDVALFTLLQKSLATGRYADVQRDRALMPAGAEAKADNMWDFPTGESVPVGLFAGGRWSDGYACPTLAATTDSLARNPADAKARLCLADFWRLNGFDRFEGLEPATDKDSLGAPPSLFPGTPVTRAALYAAVLADPRAAADEKAYALYRSVYCYAPSGINDCGGEEVPVATRRAWFQRLKKDYPASRWARQASVYW